MWDKTKPRPACLAFRRACRVRFRTQPLDKILIAEGLVKGHKSDPAFRTQFVKARAHLSVVFRRRAVTDGHRIAGRREGLPSVGRA